MSIEKAYNIWSNLYDSNDNKTRDIDRIATKKTLSQFTFETVVELGCGTGKNTEWLIDNAKTVIGIDFSEKMLQKAKHKIASKQVTFIKGDITKEWKMKNNFADLITCSLTLEHIKNIEVIFRQAHQKLKIKGLFFISELHPFKQYTGSKARYKMGEKVHELEVFTHHISEYLRSAEKNSFTLVKLDEWFDDNNKTGIPRLISFIFKKN